MKRKISINLTILTFMLVICSTIATAGLSNTAKTSGYHTILYTDTIQNADDGVPVVVINEQILDLAGGVWRINAIENDLRFQEGAAERFVIDDTGRIGIGTNAPTYQLEVQGTGTFRATSNANIGGNVNIGGNTGINGTLNAGATTVSRLTTTASGPTFTITNNDATDTSRALRVIRNNAETAYITADGTFSGSFSGDGSGLTNAGQWLVSGSDIYNKNSGNIGIGTNSPVNALDVRGSLNVSGKIYSVGDITTLADISAASAVISGYARGVNIRMKDAPGPRMALSVAGFDGVPHFYVNEWGDVNAAQIKTDKIYMRTNEQGALKLSGYTTSSSNHALEVAYGSTDATATTNAYITYDGTFSGKFSGDGSGLTNAGQWLVSGSDIYNKNSGNVGIGTSGPMYPLDVAGSSRFTGDVFAGGDFNAEGTLNVGLARYGYAWEIRPMGTTSLSFHVGTTDRYPLIMTLENNGDLTTEGKVIVKNNNIAGSMGDRLTMTTDGVTVTGDLRVNGNDILNSAGTSRITLTNTGATVNGNLKLSNRIIEGDGLNTGSTMLSFNKDADMTLTGDLTVTGNNIAGSMGDRLTMTTDGVTVTGDLRVNGNDIKDSAGNTRISFTGGTVTFYI